MWFFPVLGFALTEKLCGAKCCKFQGPEGVTFKDKVEMSPGEARNLEWMVNMHPGTENIVGHTRSEDKYERNS